IAGDTFTKNQTIGDGDTVISAGGSFKLGFFSPENSKNRYVGIWYNTIPELTPIPIWVANRETPLVDSSGVLKITGKGVLVIVNSTGKRIWSSISPSFSTRNPVAKLLNSGNLVVKEAENDDPQNFLWRSFDYPTDTFMPAMKLGWENSTGLDRFLTSWKTTDDPTPGDYTYKMEHNGFPEYFLRKGSDKKFRSGPWNGISFSGMPSVSSNPIYNFTFVLNQKEMYFVYELIHTSMVSKMFLGENGVLQRMTWMESSGSWAVDLTIEMTNCDSYSFCGSNGLCAAGGSTECGCLKGFAPKTPSNWVMADWSDGCVRETALNCGYGDGFLKYSKVKVPDTSGSWFDFSMTTKECEIKCLENCSCSAYANTDVRGGGSGCLLWFGDLVDIRELSERGQDLYVRVAASELVAAQDGRDRNRAKRILVISAVSSGTLLLIALGITMCIWKKQRSKKQGGTRHHPGHAFCEEHRNEDLELPLFHMATIASATDNFANENKLGEGGFGPVYKGMLEGGQEIAVKLLSKNSRQGNNEFKNEVICIAKLQHRNLVRLLGCCIQGEERMLIYEYMPNSSLDTFIFDQSKRMLLDWSKRFHIINGIARGLLYLHEDSRLRIIHRDLKASNILLDYEMNPKISDFGLAKIVGANDTATNTKRIVGTYGYMSPEYAIEGLFSTKSDVFSFGVLVLEIVSGKRNWGFYHPDHRLNLLGHAWRLHEEGRDIELIDASIGNSYNLVEALRSIHVGLLCVQQRPDDRPNMAGAVLMLKRESTLAQPKQPGFFAERSLPKVGSPQSKEEPNSANFLTVTMVEAR
ncbi:Non-specific serine/threonine protein kinase, partial [Bertholletia excelsa]